MLRIASSHLFITRVRNDLHWEVLHELSEVSPDVRNGDVQGFLKLDEPVSVRDLLSREQVLVLGHK